MKIFYCLFFALSVLAGCSGETDDGGTASGEHVWKTQTDSLDKARQVEGMLQEDAGDKRQMIDESESY